jgi:hypothetical protein
MTDVLYFYDNIKKEDSGSSRQRKRCLTHNGFVLCGNKIIFNLKSETEILQLSGEERSCYEERHLSDTDRRNVIQLFEFGWFCCYVKRHVPSVCLSVCLSVVFRINIADCLALYCNCRYTSYSQDKTVTKQLTLIT